MEKKSLVISASGLKNIAFTDKDEFLFIFGKRKIKMNRILADFISPRVNNLHRLDPTIKSFCFDDIFNSIICDQNSTKIFNKIINYKSNNRNSDSTDSEYEEEDDENDNQNLNNTIKNTENYCQQTPSQFYEDLFNDNVIDLFHKISIGYEIEIDEEMGVKLRLLSMIIGNEELYQKINEIFPQNINETSIDLYLLYLQNTNYYKSFPFFNEKQAIEYISNHFYSIDPEDLKNLPKPILYSIISNKQLIIESEDSLFDFITDLFEDEEITEAENVDDFNITSFYELVEFSELSEKKFNYFLNSYDPNEITNSIWRKLNKCFYFNMCSLLKKKEEEPLTTSPTRYYFSIQTAKFPYDGNTRNQFKGIIQYLHDKYKGNVNDKKVVEITSSSMYMTSSSPKNAADFDTNLYFASNNEEDAWILYDFKERKVKPTHYSIRSRRDCGKGGNHLRKWCIEGSNDMKNWKTLDIRKKEKSLDDANASNTFDIQENLEKDDFFRYIRLRQIGYNTGSNYHLNIAALEYFGSLLEKVD